MARSTKKKVLDFRARQRAAGLTRREFWVPLGLTRAEARVLQEWIPDIVEDIRESPNQREETEK